MRPDQRPTCPPHDPDPHAPKAAVPANACDCHAHVFGPAPQYSLIPEALYEPADALPEQFRHMLDVLGFERAVLVQPSVYGTDNRAMLTALARDPQRLRGVAVLPFDVETSEIERLHALGVRGVRCNIVDLASKKGLLPLDALLPLCERIKPFGWHLELLIHVNEFPDLDQQLRLPVDVVFGHLGYVPTEEGTEATGFQGLLRLLRDGKAWVKLTAPYRLTKGGMPYSEVTPFARHLLDAAPGRLVWGSDWPHTFIKSPMPNDGDLFNLFAEWVSDERTRERILVENPGLLYGF